MSQIDMTRVSSAAQETRARRVWMSLIVGLLASQVLIGVLSMYLAVGDPSGAVVPQYHQAALNWDATHRASLASQRLGWTVQIVASDVADASGQRAIEITIHDRQGNAVDELQLVGKIYHHARAADVQTIDLPAVGDGRYLTVATMPRSGLWQIDVDIRGTGEQITEAATIEIN